MSQPVLEPARTRPSGRRRVALLATAALALGSVGVVGTQPAGAAPTAVAGALAQMFSGTASGVGGPLDLSTLEGLAPVGASYPGAPGPNLLPIGTDILTGLKGALSNGGTLLGNGAIVDMGAVNQVASAAADGSALSAVGGVTDAGALDLGGLGAQAPASVDLTSLLSQVPALSTGLSKLKLTLDGIAAKATQTAGGVQSGQYDISGGSLTFVSPVLGDLPQQVLTALAPLQSAVNGLGGSSAGGQLGSLLTAFNGIPVISQILAAVGSATQNASVTSNLQTALGSLLSDPFSSPDGSVVLNPVTGLFTADLAQLSGGSLGGLPVGTDVLSPALLTGLVTQVVGLVQNLVSTIVSTVTTAIGASPVSLTSVADNGLLGLLQTGMNVDVEGTLAQVLAGTASVTQTLTLLGLPVLSLSNLQLLSALAAPVTSLLNTGAVPDFSSLLTSGLSTPAAGPLTDALNAITSILGIDVNNQSTLNGVFTQIAMVLTLIPGNPLSILNLGSAAVGPNAPGVIAPTVSAVSPARGPVAGGQTVTVTGTNFVSGLTSVTIGGTAVPAGQVNVTSTTSLSFTTPAHAAGAVSLTVTSPAGTSPAGTYTYLPKPALTRLYPASGPAAGGRPLTITGAGFVAGATTVKLGSSTVAAGSVTVTSSTRLSLKTPKRASGAVSVTVTTPGGTSSGTTYTFRSAPAITSLSRTSGATAGGRAVTIKGARFVPGQTAVSFGGWLVGATAVRVSSPTSLTVTTPAHAAGTVSVTVITSGGTSNGKSYRYGSGTRVALKNTKLDVTRGTVAGGTKVVVTGAGFVPGTTAVRIGGTTVPAARVTVVAPTTLWFRTPAHTSGLVSLRVVNGSRVSTAKAFRYVKPSAALSATPTVTSPKSGATTANQAPFVSGTGTAGAVVTVTVDGVTYCVTGVSAGKTWSCANTAPLLRGKHAVSASQKAGGRAGSRQATSVTFTEN